MSCQANTDLIEALYEEALVEVNGDEAKAEEIANSRFWEIAE